MHYASEFGMEKQIMTCLISVASLFDLGMLHVLDFEQSRSHEHIFNQNFMKDLIIFHICYRMWA